MGWFGISNSQQRARLNQSMRADLAMLAALHERLGVLGRVVDQQIGSAQSLLSRAQNESSSRMFQQGHVRATAGQLASELAFAVQDAQDFRRQLTAVSNDLEESLVCVTACLQEYSIPRGLRTLRFGPQDVPPSGIEMAATSDRIAGESIQGALGMAQANAVRVGRTFGNIEKAETLLNGPRLGQESAHRLIQEIIETR